MSDEDVGERPGYWQRRRERAFAELERNREGGHRIPTWVMVAALLAFVTAWALVIALS
jgi:hypothetical protein